MFLVETIREQENLQNGENYTVWCRLRAGDIIRPYFFKDNKVRKVTICDEYYSLIFYNPAI